MPKKRVFELAKELGLSNKDLVAKILSMGFAIKNHMSSLDDFQIDKIKKELKVGGPTEIVEKRVTRTVIRRRVQKETAEPEPDEEELAKSAEDEEEAAEAAPPEDEIKPVAKHHREANAEPKGILTRPKLKEQKVALEEEKETVQEKAKKLVKEKILTEFTVEKEKIIPEKSKYSKLKVIPQKIVVDEEKSLGKDVSKEDKIQRLRERFKPEAVHQADLELYPVKGFEKIKRKKKREVIDVKDSGKGNKYYRKKKLVKRGLKTEITTPRAIKRVIRIGDTVRVGELAKRMSVKCSELIVKLLNMGTIVTITQTIDLETAGIVAGEFGFTVERASGGEAEIMKRISGDSSGRLVRRSPVVTVMGHVDHGKTSLLDMIRKTKVTETEAGGITQKIGAYSVEIKGSKIVFIDTPGHEAFTSMRARGAKVTDLVILVVAADDGVMPQTIEAINHAKEAKVPILVAINKIDKPGVNPERIKQGLTEYGLVPEEWGGDNIIVNVSAKTGEGIPELLDMILLQAEVLDLKVDSEKLMKGVVIESRLDKGKGPIATVIVQEGTLKVGQPVIVGTEFGRVRAMQDEKGDPLEEAGPSTPIEIQGLSGVPEAGEACYVLDDERLAKQVSELRQKKLKEPSLLAKAKVSLEDLYAQIQQGALKELKLVIKADTDGSAEALKNSLSKLGTESVLVRCVHAGVGWVTEGDVMLASASNALIIAFNVRMETATGEIAERENVSVKFYDIIYNAIDDVKKAIEGLLEPKMVEKVLGRAQVKEVFNISKLGSIAGSIVIDGKIQRNAKARLLRDSVVVFEGKITSLKRFKDDARDVASGMECGIGIENFNDIKIGDFIECFEIEQVKSFLL